MNPLAEKMDRIFALTKAELEILERACARTVDFGAREDIIREGDRPWACNLLLEGMICRYKVIDGRRQILAFQHPGDIFDAYSFVLEVMSHSIATLAPSRIAIIPHEAMFEITERYPRITRAIWKDTLIDASVFTQWMSVVHCMKPASRVAHLICEFIVRRSVGDPAEEKRLAWPLTHVDLEDALSIKREEAEAALAGFERDGLITRGEGELLIRDFAGLKRAGEFNPAYLYLEPPSGPAVRSLDWVKPL